MTWLSIKIHIMDKRGGAMMASKNNPYSGTKTEKNLKEAYAGESMARNKYVFYASVAKSQGYEQIADLFLETANNELAHAKLWIKELEGIGDTLTNLNLFIIKNTPSYTFGMTCVFFVIICNL